MELLLLKYFSIYLLGSLIAFFMFRDYVKRNNKMYNQKGTFKDFADCILCASVSYYGILIVIVLYIIYMIDKAQKNKKQPPKWF